MVKVLLFGQLAEICGQRLLMLDLPDTQSVSAHLSAAFPGFEKQVFAVAVNQQLVSENTALSAGDELALMPPYSGG